MVFSFSSKKYAHWEEDCMIAYSRFLSDSSNGNCPFEYNYICEQSEKSAKGFTAGKLIFHIFEYLFIDPDQLQE